MSSSSSFVWLSDIHFDPYHDTAKGVELRGRTDTSLALLQSAVLQAQTIEDASFWLVTGDSVRHNVDAIEDTEAREFVKETLQQVSLELLALNTTTLPIIPVLGNNDVYPDYHVSLTDDTQLNQVASAWKPLISVPEPFQGYYAQAINAKLTLLILDTLLYSTQQMLAWETDDPRSQFAWLKDQLQQARDENYVVYICGHVPPALGSWHHQPLWRSVYVDAYYKITQMFADVIRGNLFGHVHTDEFRYIRETPILTTASLTPIYGAQPSIRVVDYDSDTMELLDYTTYYVDSNDTWTTDAPSFVEDFGVRPSQVGDLVDALVANPQDDRWSKIVSRQYVYANHDDCSSATCQEKWKCTWTTATRLDYQACIANTTNETFKQQSWLWSLVVLLPVVFLGCYCRQRTSKQQHYDDVAVVQPDQAEFT